MGWTPPEHEIGQDLRTVAPDWDVCVAEVLARNGLSAEGLAAEPRGSDVVWSTDRVVVKLTHPRWAEEIAAEAWGCAGAAAVGAPDVVGTGQIGGWPYVITRKLSGRPLDELWPELDHATRVVVARRIGVVTARLHALPVPAGAPTSPWPVFLAQRLEGAVQTQRKRGTPESLLAEIPDLLQAEGGALLGCEVLLHTELLDQHILLDEALEVCGLVDFADGRVGHPLYDFGALVDFIFHDEAELLGAFFEGYGGCSWTPRQLLAGYLIHMFASVPRLLKGLSRPVGSLDELAQVAFTP